MFQRTILVVLGTMLALPALAVTVITPDASLSSDERAVIAVEDDWVHAEVSHDEATLRRVIDDQFVFNQNSGQTSGKEALIGGVMSGSMSGQTISERSILVEGDTAVIFGTAELQFVPPDGEATSALLRYTTVYVKRDGQWRAIALHMAGRTSG